MYNINLCFECVAYITIPGALGVRAVGWSLEERRAGESTDVGEPQQGSAVGLWVLGEAFRVLCGSCNWPCRTEHIITGLLQSPAVATGGGLTCARTPRRAFSLH